MVRMRGLPEITEQIVVEKVADRSPRISLLQGRIGSTRAALRIGSGPELERTLYREAERLLILGERGLTVPRVIGAGKTNIEHFADGLPFYAREWVLGEEPPSDPFNTGYGDELLRQALRFGIEIGRSGLIAPLNRSSFLVTRDPSRRNLLKFIKPGTLREGTGLTKEEAYEFLRNFLPTSLPEWFFQLNMETVGRDLGYVLRAIDNGKLNSYSVLGEYLLNSVFPEIARKQGYALQVNMDPLSDTQSGSDTNTQPTYLQTDTQETERAEHLERLSRTTISDSVTRPLKRNKVSRGLLNAVSYIGSQVVRHPDLSLMGAFLGLAEGVQRLLLNVPYDPLSVGLSASTAVMSPILLYPWRTTGTSGPRTWKYIARNAAATVGALYLLATSLMSGTGYVSGGAMGQTESPRPPANTVTTPTVPTPTPQTQTVLPTQFPTPGSPRSGYTQSPESQVTSTPPPYLGDKISGSPAKLERGDRIVIEEIRYRDGSLVIDTYLGEVYVRCRITPDAFKRFYENKGKEMRITSGSRNGVLSPDQVVVGRQTVNEALGCR